MNRTAGQLADILAALPVRVSSVRVRADAVALVDYPGPPGGKPESRPTSVVHLSGAGVTGFGENVAFTAAEHEQFATEAEAFLRPEVRGNGARVDAALSPDVPPYARAALEAALIDLAMRQAGVSLSDLSGTASAPLRVVQSFAARPDFGAHIALLRAAGWTGEFKVDVSPQWDVSARRQLATAAGIVILDFKGRGDAALAAEVAAACPSALLEDPPPHTIAPGRIARDAPLADAGAVAAAWARGESVNLKAPRMGGPLALLRGLAETGAARPGATVAAQDARDGAPIAYLGGMFEVGVGRSQARQVAALFCPTAPNDLAPVPLTSGAAASTLIRLDTPGFGVPARDAGAP